MRHPIVITLATLLVAAIVYLAVYAISRDSRAAIGSLTVSGLTSLILMSAYDSTGMKKAA